MTEEQTVQLDPWDVLETQGWCSTRLYEVEAVLWGGVGHESVIQLRPMDASIGHPLLVPIEMVVFGIKAGIITQTKHGNFDTDA